MVYGGLKLSEERKDLEVLPYVDHPVCPKCKCVDVGKQACELSLIGLCFVEFKHNLVWCRSCRYDWIEHCKEESG